MRTVVQRVTSAQLRLVGPDRVETAHARIGVGLVALIGVERGDTDKDAAWTAEKLAHLRVFEDAGGKMNRSALDLVADGAAASVLAVPNFTVAGSAQKGRRPSFDTAEDPAPAHALFDRVRAAIEALGLPAQAGVFGADMRVELVNDGPMTLIVASR